MTLERLEVCPVCNGTTFHPFLSCKDHTTTGELFHVEQCTACDLLLTNPRPSAADSAAYYLSTSYISHTSKATGIVDYIYLIFRRLTVRWKLGLIKRYLKTNTLLDVGCGTGNFLKHCKERGVNTVGVEVSDEARHAAVNNNLRVEKSLDNLSNEKFSVITLWHVLEHIYHLETTLLQLKNMLELAINGCKSLSGALGRIRRTQASMAFFKRHHERTPQKKRPEAKGDYSHATRRLLCQFAK